MSRWKRGGDPWQPGPGPGRLNFGLDAIRAAIAILLINLCPSAGLSAQVDGTPIRVQTTAKPHRWITGQAAGITSDSVGMIRNRCRDTLRNAWSDLHQMDVSVGRRSDAGMRAVEGSILFGGLGLALGLGCTSLPEPCDAGDVVMVTAIGAAGGAAVGAVIGSFSHHEKWETVKLGPNVSAGLQRRRSVGLSIEF